MLINIGPSKEPSDIVDLLLECHERIRLFIGLARRMAEAQHASKDEVQDAAARVCRYFSEALPLHVADEEESIMPRLSGRRREVDSALDAMRRQHKTHESGLEQLLQTCRLLELFPERFDERRESLRRVAAELERDLNTHLREEEAVVVPAIRSLLTAEEREAMLSEFRARRSR